MYGVVKGNDDGLPIPVVSVAVKDGTVTDADRKYKMDIIFTRIFFG